MAIVFFNNSSTKAQFPLSPSPVETENNNSSLWDLNKSFSCGRFFCSNVYIYDDDGSNNFYSGLLTPELTVATINDITLDKTKIQKSLEERAKLIQNIFKQILSQTVNHPVEPELKPVFDGKFWIPFSIQKLFNANATIKLEHPWTPQVEIGVKNNLLVIYVPDQFHMGLPNQDIVTVTKVDALANGTDTETLAKIWRDTIRNSFSNALWGYQFDLQYPFGRWFVSGAVFLGTILIIYIIYLFQFILKKLVNKLKFKLEKLKDSLAINRPYSVEEINISEKEKSTQEITTIEQKEHNNNGIFSNFYLQKNIFSKSKAISIAKILLHKQNILRQEINLIQLILRILFIIQICFLSFGFVIICLIFRKSRFFSVYLFKETFIIIGIWLILIFLDKLSDVFIDYTLNIWAKEKQYFHPESNRYSLRADTYSNILKRTTTFFSLVLGLYFTIIFLGINPAILTGAGVLAVTIAILSRNLLEGLLNGILILGTDRYTLGDVIDLGNDIAGTVEDINLFTTTLRNLDGQAIAVPNSQINTVINKTKYWSRVNFTIKIGFQEDVKKAIAIMLNIAEKMQKDPLWEDYFLEPAELLGVDEVSYQGVEIHLLIKTPPSQQWTLGREYRLRVKEAFEKEGISLGIPHHKVSVINWDVTSSGFGVKINSNSSDS